MRRNIVGALVAAVGLVLLGTASSFASGMGHHSMKLSAGVNSLSPKATETPEASPEPSDTPQATPTPNAASVMLNMNGITAGSESDDSTGDDSSTKTSKTPSSGDDHSSSGGDD